MSSLEEKKGREMSGKKTIHARIEGRVQGVWYRAWTMQQANARGLSGWVRNRFDGTVEAVFHGPPSKVDEMVTACYQGPPAARVERIHANPSDPPEREGFYKLANG